MSATSRKALVVGINAYTRAPLRCCVYDASAVHAALQRMGFTSELILDCDIDTLITATRLFVSSVMSDDIVLFYFAGHGMEAAVRQAGKQATSNWLIARQVPESTADLPRYALDAHNLLAELEARGARFNALVLDCCRDDPLPAEGRSLGGGGLASMDPKGSLVAFACAPGARAAELPNRPHGVFTDHLLRHIDTPGLDINTLFIRVGNAVEQATRHLSPVQRPYVNHSLRCENASLLPVNWGDSLRLGETVESLQPPPPPQPPLSRGADALATSATPVDWWVDRGEDPKQDDVLRQHSGRRVKANTHQGGEECTDDVLEKGAAMLYRDKQSGKTVRVTVCTVHFDHTPPSYSIRLPTGQERDTLRERLEREPMDESPDTSDNGAADGTSGAATGQGTLMEERLDINDVANATSCAAAANGTPMDESADIDEAGLGGGNGPSTRGVFPIGSELSMDATHPMDLSPAQYETLAARERAAAPELDEQPSVECCQFVHDILTSARADETREGLHGPSMGAWSHCRRAHEVQRLRGLTNASATDKLAEDEACKRQRLSPMIAPQDDDISSFSSDECSHDAVSRDGTNGGDESDGSNDGAEELPQRVRSLTILGGTPKQPNSSVTPSDKGVDDEDVDGEDNEPAGPDLTYSGIACPRDPRDLEQEVRQALERMLGAGNAEAVRSALSSGHVAVTEWEREEGEAVKELSTEGFFAMVAPHVFVNGSCDITIPQLVRLSLHEWIRHIYWTGDGRVPRHRNLKFILFNLMLRKRALEQGGFLVAQQLDDAHLGIAALRAAHESGDDSVARKIISVGGNLINTDTYWRERKRELDAMHSWRRARHGDLPAYFQTNSIAEYHDPLLHRVLALYISRTRGDVDERASSFETALHHLRTDNSYLRDVLQECGHITTTYFDAHATNYYATVLKEVMQYDDAWWRYEFAKSRGAIHSHSLLSSRMHRAMTEAAQRCGWSDWAAERARQPPEEDDEDEDAADEARRDEAAQHLACFLCDETAYAPEAEDLRNLEAIVREATRPQPHADLNLSAPSLRCRLTEQDGAPVGPGFVSLHPAGTTTPGVPDTSRWAPPEGSEPEAGQPGGPPSHLLRSRLHHALAAGNAGVPEFHRNLCNRLLLHGCSSGYCLSKKKDKVSKKKCAAAPLALTPEPKATAGG